MNILIVEDEPQAADRLATLVQSERPSWIIQAKLDSVRRAVHWLKEHPMPELIFLDIQLADGLSFEIFEQTNVTAPIIFTTAYNEYALKAFKVNSIDYLLKPVDPDELKAALKKFDTLSGGVVPQAKIMESITYAMQMLTKKYKERFVLKVGEHLKSIEVKDILFFYSLEKTTFAQSVDGRKHILDFTLDQLEGLLNPDRYFRINRKYIVSADAINDMVSYTNSRLKLAMKHSDDADVVVARERVQEFKDWLDR